MRLYYFQILRLHKISRSKPCKIVFPHFQVTLFIPRYPVSEAQIFPPILRGPRKPWECKHTKKNSAKHNILYIAIPQDDELFHLYRKPHSVLLLLLRTINFTCLNVHISNKTRSHLPKVIQESFAISYFSVIEYVCHAYNLPMITCLFDKVISTWVIIYLFYPILTF